MEEREGDESPNPRGPGLFGLESGPSGEENEVDPDGERGRAKGVEGRSRDSRLFALTERPASWSERMRSAMLPPDLRIGPSADEALPFCLRRLVNTQDATRGKRKDVLRGRGLLDLSQLQLELLRPCSKISSVVLSHIPFNISGPCTLI